MPKEGPGPKERRLQELRQARAEEKERVTQPIAPLLPTELDHAAWVLARARAYGCESTVKLLLKLPSV